MSETMHAVGIHRYGGPEVLSYENLARPEPRRGEVSIHVAAAGVNPIDWKTRAGKGLAPRYGERFPLILGWDLAGTVVALGEKAAGVAVGDEVFGMVHFPRPGGTYAEFATAPADHVVARPESLEPAAAAGVPLVALTAWQALFSAARLEAGQKVLIHAAAGGVGHVAVQLARLRGATVVGTASERNHDFLRQLGAERVIDYTQERFEEVLDDVDVVLDSIGGEVREKSWQVLKPGGVLVSIVGDPASPLAEVLGVRAAKVLVEPNIGQLGQIAELIDAGRLRVEIERTFPLAEAAEAHRHGERGHTRGKLVLVV